MKSHHAYQFAAMKAALVERILEGQISVTEAARSVKKSRVAIYDWMTRYRMAGLDGLLPKKTGPKGGRAWNRTPEEQEQMVLALIDAHPTENIYDLADHLERRLHPSTIWRIWKRHRQSAAAKRLPRSAPQRYVKEEVGEEIQMDTSFPWGRGAERVCFDCLDDHSRFAFAKLFPNCTQDSAIAFLHYVIARAPFIIAAIRTDCGREWSTRFSIACALAGIRHIRNEPYHPEHNGKIEKFHDGLKYRCFYVYLYPSDSIEQQNVDLQQWLIWYNYHKRHFGLGMHRRTPAEVVLQALLSQSSCVRLMLQPNNSSLFFPFVPLYHTVTLLLFYATHPHSPQARCHDEEALRQSHRALRRG